MGLDESCDLLVVDGSATDLAVSAPVLPATATAPACGPGQRRYRNPVKDLLLGSLPLGCKVTRDLLLAGGDLGGELVDPLAHRSESN